MATIASLLRERVTLQVNSVDRVFLAGYMPKLQSEGQVVRFLLDRGFPIPSPAALGKIGDGYVRAIERFARKHRISVVRFKKGESKELVARRLRTETTINDPQDFGVGRTLNAANWLALTRIGHETNERLLSAQLAACDCAPDSTTLHQVVSPSTEDGLPAPALRFGEQRVMALLSCLCSYRHLFAGLTNKSLRELITAVIPGYGSRQMTYDLRRLRRKGVILRVDETQRYELTDHGRRIAVFFTKTYTRIVNPSLAELDSALPHEIAQASPLGRAWRAFEHALDARIADAQLTA